MQDYKLKSIYLLQGLFSSEALKKLKFSKGGHVFVTEGRPSLEAGRKTTGALLKQGITPTIISDNMPGFLFFKGCGSLNATGIRVYRNLRTKRLGRTHGDLGIITIRCPQDA